ncbi:2-hydroxy-3-oxopropionate reductase [Roseomonas marmotae]|uniref:2-hydroxy-3-oxopropionate reductase n=1 Tax=Roseomonas marmotae TaxID=2768161 RepID=A0ABS3KC00_9PROT|nr:2-hydroxy-3-oxopropionate reductase [Roseomonas marmotae]MBO1074995.1 2-hydroxy-3-oxopropionate reductase [Roseomonas marmotae]QTI80813.1 2-hydroxy-3-oxopropionate reductase [Roseomonas marmotae]
MGESVVKIGFIGLGIMGRPMARHLLDAGHSLAVPERGSLPAEFRAVAQVLPTPRAVAEQSEVVILMLPDTPDVEGVLLGADGVLAGLRKGTLVIDMSSISPTATQGFARQVEAAGCEWLDAPVSGGEVGAKAASLTIMVGGSEAAFARGLPLFQLMGKNITHVGEAGAGQTCKVANQMIVAANIQAVAEALTFARKAGADPGRVRQALLGGFAASRVLEVHGQRMVDRTFQPGFRIRLHQKDLKLALTAAQEMALPLPGTAVTQQLFSACAAQGNAELDHSALVTAIEALGGMESEKT